jgi:hypothetical protein
LHPARLSLAAAAARGWLAGPLLLALLVSPPVETLAEQSLVIHHFAHWLMVVAGALAGYHLRNLVRLPAAAVVAWAGLGAALLWHLPPLLRWAEVSPVTHVFAHATLVAGGGALGWAVPRLGGPAKAYLFIAANVIMWPLVLAEIAGAFTYSRYPGQESQAGVAELVAMTLSWLVLGFWTKISLRFSRPLVSIMVQAVLATLALAGWVLPRS